MSIVTYNLMFYLKKKFNLFNFNSDLNELKHHDHSWPNSENWL